MNEHALQQTFQNACRALLHERGENGCWEGELSTSALSTATAVFALQSYLDAESSAAETAVTHFEGVDLAAMALRGVQWLAKNQNDDGGWGDTVKSFSNISTTALCWAALAKADTSSRFPDAAKRAEAWLRKAAGSLNPKLLAEAISRRYGQDRTFSVPILTTLALAGKLGPQRTAWRLIPQLPFELAVCPHRWFQIIRLPVVSYALPALIAMGLVRHRHLPTWNPLARALRYWATAGALRVLKKIQPASGGFLEAAPLTSFVVLSLIGAGEAGHPVVAQGLRFLLKSVRTDGSWPIDTNLATWVTTLSVNALASGGVLDSSLDAAARQRLLDWLLGQQYQEEHPYTHAPPGGWAWTDLSGGVPDADDTPGALLALHHLAPDDKNVQLAAAKGIVWLLNVQNRDGGIPTFCRGWGALPFDRSSADLTAHAVRAWLVWRPAMSGLPRLQGRIDQAIRRAEKFLTRQQNEQGAWAPLWFGNQHLTIEENLTYGTSRVLLAIAASRAADWNSGQGMLGIAAQLRAVQWLHDVQNNDGGWGGDRNTPSSVEETALAVEALCAMAATLVDEKSDDGNLWPIAELHGAIERGIAWLAEHTQQGAAFDACPIGFYFAKLWYFERLYPYIFSVAALGRYLKTHADLQQTPT